MVSFFEGDNIKKCWDSNVSYKGMAYSSNGHCYALPAYSSGTSIDIRTFMVNDRWLENCGIESYPTNLDEFKEMLIKFRDMDANGNGDPNDEIPLQSGLNIFMYLFADTTGMMSYWPYTGVLYSSDLGRTETYPVFMEERYRYIVEYLADLYAEGLVDSDMFSVSSDEQNARRQSDRYGVLPSQTWPDKVEKYDPDEWTSMPLMGSKYLTEREYATGIPGFVATQAAVSANTEYPEAVIRLLDYMFSVEGSYLFRIPKTPDNYDFTNADINKDVLAYLNEKNAETVDQGIMGANFYGTSGCFWNGALNQYQLPTTEYANNLLKTLDELRVPYGNSGKVNYVYSHLLKFTSEENEVIAQYKTDLDTYVKERLSLWISGEEQLTDDTWQKYIEQCKKLHVDELTKVYQKAVDRYYSE